MIGHRTHFRENDDSPPWRGPAAKKNPPFFNARALIAREIMRSRDAQCNRGMGNDLKSMTHYVKRMMLQQFKVTT